MKKIKENFIFCGKISLKFYKKEGRKRGTVFLQEREMVYWDRKDKKKETSGTA